jgi:hypothetical protein
MGNEMTLGDKNNMGKWITDNGTEFVRPRRLTRTEFVRQVSFHYPTCSESDTIYQC